MVAFDISAVMRTVDVPFNVGLVIILICVYWCLFWSKGILLAAIAVTTATIFARHSSATLGEKIKVLCLLPAGLGSVLAFLVANPDFQAEYRTAFTHYINFAVYGNIAIMIGTPTGGTVRGYCSKVTCVTLLLWILQQGRSVKWSTITPHDQILVFTAVDKPWIIAHAIYRFILLTLPCFGGGNRHRLLELYSLALTALLSLRLDLPFEYCFGMADTLVVPTLAAWSAIATAFDIVPKQNTRDAVQPGSLKPNIDLYLATASLAVAAFAVLKICSVL